MLDFLNTATDNEMAVLGCLAVLFGSLGMMFLSGAAFGTAGGETDEAGGDRSSHVRGELDRPAGRRAADQEAA